MRRKEKRYVMHSYIAHSLMKTYLKQKHINGEEEKDMRWITLLTAYFNETHHGLYKAKT